MQDRSETKNTSYLLPVLLAVFVTALMAAVLHLMGRFWWCQQGDAAVYIHEAWGSSHTSQHLLDPYTLTHVLHGVLFFWLAGLLLAKLAAAWQFVAAIVAEAGWEVLENSSYVIEKYRENTASFDYFGDTIANSIGDVTACAAGFLIAIKFGMWRSLVFFVGVELFLLLWIRDSLLLNILMLVYPLEGIKSWQMGGVP
jgi:hypothetical protein